jgi:hypothetical protein
LISLVLSFIPAPFPVDVKDADGEPQQVALPTLKFLPLLHFS